MNGTSNISCCPVSILGALLSVALHFVLCCELSVHAHADRRVIASAFVLRRPRVQSTYRHEHFPSVSSSRISATIGDNDIENMKELPKDFPKRADALAAVSAVRKACSVTARLQPLYGPNSGKSTEEAEGTNEVATVSKTDASPVTVGDFSAQAIVLSHLASAFPTDALIAEESSSVLRSDPGLTEIVLKATSEHITKEDDLWNAIDLGQTYNSDGEMNDTSHSRRVWTLDPIDGTKGFLRGRLDGGQYAIALALLEDGVPTIGVLGCPNLPTSANDDNYEWGPDETENNNKLTRGCIFVASKGGGCYQLPLAPSKQGESGSHRVGVTASDGSTMRISDARFCIGVELGFNDPLGRLNSIAEILHGTGALDKDGSIIKSRRIDSQAKHGVIARGGGELLLRLPKPDYVEWIWDHAAGFVVITEAGGKMTDVDGNDIDFSLGAKLSKDVRGIAVSSGGIYHEKLLNAYQQQEEARPASVK